MSEIEPSFAAEAMFYSSNQSPLGKAKKWLWAGALLSLVMVLATQKNGAGFPVFTIIVLAIFFFGLWLYQRKLMRPGQALVTVQHDFIESPLFRGEQKRFAWTEIEAVAFKTEQNSRRLEFKLVDRVDRPDKRNFWNGANDARPFILLSVFDPLTQEKMLDAVNHQIAAGAAEDSLTNQTVSNEITVEREFQEHLKSLAPTPWLTYGLIGANILVWLLMLAKGAGFVTVGADKLLLWGGNAASEVQRGEWWRLLSSTFMHGGFMHLTMNMIGLFVAGVTVERIYGQRLFALIYLGAGLSGSALSLHFGAQNAVAVGASGAVFGVTGALLVAVFQHRDKLPKTFSKQTISGLSFFILYALMQGFAKQGIDNAAHVGGLLGGCVLAFLLPERFDMAHFSATIKQRAMIGLAIICVATLGMAATAPQASLDQMGRLKNHTAFMQAMGEFAKAMLSLQQEQEAIQAGKLTERESDERSRSVHAPVFRQVLTNLKAVSLLDSDPRQPLLRDTQRMTELLVESLAMESVYVEGSNKPEPVNPERMTAIEREIKEISDRLQKMAGDKRIVNNK